MNWKNISKHISWECNCQVDGTNCNSNQWWNNDKSQCECKKHHICEKDYVWNPAAWKCENGKHWTSILDDSLIICDEVIESFNEEIKTIPTNLNEKKVTCQTQYFYILLAFLLITITLLIAANI